MTAVLVHEVPCRLRYQVQRLKNDPRRAELLRERVAAVPGVVRASANALTGSLIVAHDGQAGTRERIGAALEACGHPVRPDPHAALALVPVPAERTEIHPLLRVLAETLVEKLLHTALAAVI